MSVLDAKLLRDLMRLWAQVLAIALVVAGGFTSLVAATGSFRSLDETRAAYYERHQFADVFAAVRRAPKSLVPSIEEIPGVAAVEVRIFEIALLDIPGFREPATGRFISLPETGELLLNRPYMRVGRMPDAGSLDEVLIGESFAIAQGFELGDRFSAILNGRKRALTIVGIALSPERHVAHGGRRGGSGNRLRGFSRACHKERQQRGQSGDYESEQYESHDKERRQRPRA